MSINIADGEQKTQNDQSSSEQAALANLADRVASLSSAVVKGVERQIAPYGLIGMEFAMLKAFVAQEEWTVTQLTEVLPADAPRVSRLVSRLVDRGLLRRRRRTDDRRVVRLRLTPQGEELTATVCQVVEQFEASLLEGLSAEDGEALDSAISRIVANHAALQEHSR